MDTAVRTVTLNERRIGHVGIVEHEISPLNAHQLECRLRIASDKVGFELKATGKWRDRRWCTSTLGGWGTIWTPTRLKVVGNSLDLGGVERQVGKDYVKGA